MNTDGIKTGFAMVIAAAILAGTFYALVLSPFVVEADVKLWLTGASGWAIGFVFGDRIASQAVKQASDSAAQGAEQALTTPASSVTQTGSFPTVTQSGQALDPDSGGSQG